MKRATALLAMVLALELAVPCSRNVAGAVAGKWVSMNTDGLNFQSINCIALDPQHPDTVYAGTGEIAQTGDIFKSTDGGSSWRAMKATSNGMQNVTGISSVLVDPSNTSVVFAQIFGSSSTAGYTWITRWGLFKSTDGGSTWKEISDGLPADKPISCLAMDPTNTSVLYAGTANGLFRSNDGGTTWKKINDGLKYGEVDSLLINPSNPSIMYGLGALSAFKSSDGGLTWSPTGNGILSESYVDCLALDPINPSIVYAGTNVGLFKSGDAGTTWNKTGGELYVESIVIDSSDTSTIYVRTAFDGLFKSTDSGLTWGEINRGLEGGGGWVGDLVQDPSNTSVLYVEASDRGVLKSTDGGLTWNPVNKGLEKPLAPDDGFSVSLVGVDPANFSVLYVNTSSGLFKTTDQGTSWHPINDGLRYDGAVTSFAIDPLSTSVLYATLTNSDRKSLGLFKSVDGGSHWAKESDVFAGDGWITSIAIDPSTTSTMYAVSSGGIPKSTDGGLNWNAINNGLNAEETLAFSLAIDPTNTSVIYAGNWCYGGSKSIDGGSTWTAFNNGLDKAGTIFCIVIDPSNTSVLYAGIGPMAYLDVAMGDTGVFKSTDGGASWTAVNSGLGDTTDVTSLAMDPTTSSVLYAATWGGGVFRSTDAGNHWQKLSDGLTTEYVSELVIASKPSTILYACTSDGNLSQWVLGTTSTTSPPSVPAGVTATSSVTDVRLNWSVATAGTSPLGGYAVYRSSSPGGTTGTAVATVSAAVTSWTDTTCQQGTTYYYSVAAFDTGQTPLYSAKSGEVSATLLKSSPPSVPAGLTATSSVTTVTLSWSASTAGTSSLGGYAVYRSTTAGSPGNTPAATVSATVTTWTDTSCQQGTTYYYSVAAFDSQGAPLYSEKSSEVSAKLQLPPPAVLTLTLQIGSTRMLVSRSDGTSDTVTLDAAPVLGAGNRTLVPVRAVAEAMGGTVGWDATTKTASVTVGTNTLELTLGKNTALFNGTATPIDTDPKVLPLIINGRTMLPLRFVVESLGAQVSYDQATKTIMITYTKT